jgi:hypothetical protein
VDDGPVVWAREVDVNIFICATRSMNYFPQRSIEWPARDGKSNLAIIMGESLEGASRFDSKMMSCGLAWQRNIPACSQVLVPAYCSWRIWLVGI